MIFPSGTTNFWVRYSWILFHKKKSGSISIAELRTTFYCSYYVTRTVFEILTVKTSWDTLDNGSHYFCCYYKSCDERLNGKPKLLYLFLSWVLPLFCHMVPEWGSRIRISCLARTGTVVVWRIFWSQDIKTHSRQQR